MRADPSPAVGLYGLLILNENAGSRYIDGDGSL